MKIWKQLTFGLLVWIVPFVTGFLFFTPSGEMAISETFFKTIMIVVSSVVGTGLAVVYFRNVTTAFVRTGLMLGLVWMIVNWTLDLLLVAVGFFDMSYGQYFTDIGLRYLNAIIITTGLGMALQHSATHHDNEAE